MKIDYQGEYKKQLQSNILLVREQIDNEDFVLKITNHAIKYDREYSEVKSIHKTNSHQLSVILNGSYKFKYYRIK